MLVDLAAAQQLGQGLTMKQLVLLQSSTATTTRRRIRKLIEEGKVVKLPNAMDGRSEIYGIAKDLWGQYSEVRAALQKIYGEMISRSRIANRGSKRRKAI